MLNWRKTELELEKGLDDCIQTNEIRDEDVEI
jgi:hypothetical protein